METGSSQCWSSATRFDIRHLADPTEADKCLLQCGPNLRDIYCYKACGSSVIAKHSAYVKNVAIDFRNQHEDEKPEEPSIRQILLQFRNLTRLRLKLDDSRYNYFYFIQHLPHTMYEIHLLGDTLTPQGPSLARIFCEDPTPKKFLDLTKFSQLQALTLAAFTFRCGSLFGLERLKNLKYLRLDYARFDRPYFNAIKLYRKLEHLSLAFFNISPNDLGYILKANENLKFLNLTGLCSIANEFLHLWTLKQLKILGLPKVRWNLDRISFSSSLEYFDCSNNFNAKDAQLSVLIWAFPNLKALNVAGCKFSSQFISVVEKELSKRKHELILKLHLGQRVPLTPPTSQRLQCSELPDNEYANLFNYDYWNGWYTNDEEEIKSDDFLPVIAPIADNSSPIEVLTDDCLEKIFMHLSITERLTIKQVCKRWENDALGSWYMQKHLDVRDITPHEDIQKFIPRCGRYLNDLYCYKSCGLSSLPTTIPKICNLAIDFQNRPCECASHDEQIGSPSINLMLKQFNNLTRLMFRTFDFHRMHSFLEHLPDTMKELHIFNQGFVPHPDSENTATRINLSKFINLRALTLTNLTKQIVGDNPVVYINGLEQLEKLNYLRLFGAMWFEYSNEPFKNIRNLEYLYIKQNFHFHIDFTAMVQNNRNLKCLVLSHIQDIPTPALDAISTLRKLQYLRFEWLDCSHQVHILDRWAADLPQDRMRGMPSLEYLHFQDVRRIPDATLLRIIANSPNLKIVNVQKSATSQSRHDAHPKQIIEAAKKATLTRTDGAPLKIFLGRDGLEKAECLVEDIPSHIILDDIPTFEYYCPFEDDFWGGWYTKD